MHCKGGVLSVKNSPSSIFQQNYLSVVNQSCVQGALSAFTCLLWKGYISCPTTKYVRLVCRHVVARPASSSLWTRRFLRGVFIQPCNLFKKTQWRRVCGIQAIVLRSVRQRCGIGNIPRSPTLLCVCTRLCIQTDWRRETRRERHCVSPPDQSN